MNVEQKKKSDYFSHIFLRVYPQGKIEKIDAFCYFCNSPTKYSFIFEFHLNLCVYTCMWECVHVLTTWYKVKTCLKFRVNKTHEQICLSIKKYHRKDLFCQKKRLWQTMLFLLCLSNKENIIAEAILSKLIPLT